MPRKSWKLTVWHKSIKIRRMGNMTHLISSPAKSNTFVMVTFPGFTTPVSSDFVWESTPLDEPT